MDTKILITENHRPTALSIKHAFAHLGYSLVFRTETSHALDYLGQNEIDVLIVGSEPEGLRQDKMCERVRTLGFQTPILVMSKEKNTNESIRMLRVGADDYVAKPYSYNELVARTKRLVDRPPGIKTLVVKRAGLTLNLQTNLFATASGEVLNLKPREYQILKILFENAGRPVSREMLAGRLSTSKRPASAEAVDVHISRLRKKIRKSLGTKIQTSYGQGYLLTSQKLIS